MNITNQQNKKIRRKNNNYDNNDNITKLFYINKQKHNYSFSIAKSYLKMYKNKIIKVLNQTWYNKYLWVQSYKLSNNEISELKIKPEDIRKLSTYHIIKWDISQLFNIKAKSVFFQYHNDKHSLYYPKPIVCIYTNEFSAIKTQESKYEPEHIDIPLECMSLAYNDVITINKDLYWTVKPFHDIPSIANRLKNTLNEKLELYSQPGEHFIFNLKLNKALEQLKLFNIHDCIIDPMVIKLVSTQVLTKDHDIAKILFDKIKASYLFILANTQKIIDMDYSQKVTCVFYLIHKLSQLLPLHSGRNDPFGLKKDIKNLFYLMMQLNEDTNILDYFSEEISIILTYVKDDFKFLFAYLKSPAFTHLIKHVTTPSLFLKFVSRNIEFMKQDKETCRILKRIHMLCMKSVSKDTIEKFDSIINIMDKQNNINNISLTHMGKQVLEMLQTFNLTSSSDESNKLIVQLLHILDVFLNNYHILSCEENTYIVFKAWLIIINYLGFDYSELPGSLF